MFFEGELLEKIDFRFVVAEGISRPLWKPEGFRYIFFVLHLTL